MWIFHLHPFTRVRHKYVVFVCSSFAQLHKQLQKFLYSTFVHLYLVHTCRNVVLINMPIYVNTLNKFTDSETVGQTLPCIRPWGSLVDSSCKEVYLTYKDVYLTYFKLNSDNDLTMHKSGFSLMFFNIYMYQWLSLVNSLLFILILTVYNLILPSFWFYLIYCSKVNVLCLNVWMTFSS